MEHTPEPWSAKFEQSGGYDCMTNAWVIPEIDAVLDRGDGRVEADARRIVACVNACRGIPTKLLENCSHIGAVDWRYWKPD